MNAQHVIAVLLLFAFVAACGCTGTKPGTPPGTPTPSATVVQQTTASLSPGPTDTMPANIAVSVTVSEKEYDGKITVSFDGGKGQINVQRIDVKLTRYDGSEYSTTLGKNKGDEVVLEGTRGSGSERGQSDRVEVRVAMNNGQTYKIVDLLREYRSRG